MKLPNGESAILDLRKIHDYCLSLVHPRGKHKARVFELVLGMTAEDSAHCNVSRPRTRPFKGLPISMAIGS
jgi:hypothetical protein